MSTSVVSFTSFSHPNKSNQHKLADTYYGACISVDGFKKLNRVGEGTYGIVYRAKTPKNDIVALKRIRINHHQKESSTTLSLSQEGFPISALREISLLSRISHENIVSVYQVGVAEGLENVFMIMEYCAQDMAYLMDHVMSRSTANAYKPAEVKCLLKQLLKGVGRKHSSVAYLHKNAIIHRDLKLSNILLTSKGILKIADFGLARIIDGSMTPRVVTLWYRAPEILFGDIHYTEAIDLWSIGCIFGEWMRSIPLLPGKSDLQQLVLICRLLGTPSPQIWPSLSSLPHYQSIMKNLPQIPYDSLQNVFVKSSKEGRKLLQRFLVYMPQKRISAIDALEHEFFAELPRACLPAYLPTFPELRNERCVEEREISDDRLVKKQKMDE